MKHVIKIEETPRHRGDVYFVMLNGEKWGELYFNMTGYVGALPLPSGAKFSPGERGISTWKREASRINREARHALVDNAGLNDRKLEGGIKAAGDIVEIVDEFRQLQNEFLASKGMTMNQAFSLSAAERDDLSNEFAEWRVDRKAQEEQPGPKL